MTISRLTKIYYASIIAIVLTWVVILALMGKESMIPFVVGGFIAGWYANRIMNTLKLFCKSQLSGKGHCAK